ncbi:hypothetical protein WN48_04760 [Eufriesea mexicana]|nr:hypothetical protein WN48_04760 [Eufriesea mexicana]
MVVTRTKGTAEGVERKRNKIVKADKWWEKGEYRKDINRDKEKAEEWEKDRR